MLFEFTASRAGCSEFIKLNPLPCLAAAPLHLLDNLLTGFTAPRYRRPSERFHNAASTLLFVGTRVRWDVGDMVYRIGFGLQFASACAYPRRDGSGAVGRTGDHRRTCTCRS